MFCGGDTAAKSEGNGIESGGAMTLFEECLAALGSYKIAKIYEAKMALANLSLTDYGRLDFRRYKRSREISLSELGRLGDFSCYIIYNNAELPVVRCRFKQILVCLDDVLAPAFDTWILDEKFSRIIEFYHDGGVTLAEI